jgi:hypothetical protein
MTTSCGQSMFGVRVCIVKLSWRCGSWFGWLHLFCLLSWVLWLWTFFCFFLSRRAERVNNALHMHCDRWWEHDWDGAWFVQSKPHTILLCLILQALLGGCRVGNWDKNITQSSKITLSIASPNRSNEEHHKIDKLWSTYQPLTWMQCYFARCKGEWIYIRITLMSLEL